MPVQFYLRPNPLPGRESHHMAQVVSVESLDEDALIERMAGGEPPLPRAQIEPVMRRLREVVTGLLANGCRVNVAGLAHFFPVMNGKFRNADDEFDKKRHEIGVAAAVDVSLVSDVKSRAAVEKQKPAELLPAPTFYKETGVRVAEGKVIAGNIGTLHGRRLAFDPKMADEGVFFVSTADPKREVRSKVYAVVHPTEILFQVPDGLEKGNWLLEVRARVRGGRQLRSGRLSSPLEADA